MGWIKRDEELTRLSVPLVAVALVLSGLVPHEAGIVGTDQVFQYLQTLLIDVVRDLLLQLVVVFDGAVAVERVSRVLKRKDGPQVPILDGGQNVQLLRVFDG